MMGKRTRRGLLAAFSFTLLAGCGWFGGDAPVGKARPGADRQIAPTGTLPTATPGRQSEQGVTPVDETRGAVGSVVAGKGGQRAQKEAADKAAAERDAADREAAKAKQQSAPSSTPPTGSPPAATPATPELAPATPKS